MSRVPAFVLFASVCMGCGGEGGLFNRNNDDTGLVDNDNDAEVYPGAPEFCGDGRVTDCDRKDENGTITVGDEAFTDLQEALDYASADDEVLICPGTYLGTFTGRSPVAMRGLQGAAVTVVGGDGDGSTLSVHGGTSMEGLTVTSGDAARGGGILVLDDQGLSLQDCIVDGNVAGEGGGIYAPAGARVTLADTVVSNNTAITSGGGVYVDDGELLLRGSATIESNTARTGAGVLLANSRMEGGRIRANTAVDTALGGTKSGDPGTIRAPGGSGLAALGRSSVVGTDIGNNISLGVAGGAVMVLDGVDLTLDAVLVHNNISDQQGGGLEIRGGALHLTNGSEVYANVSDANRGSGANIEGGTLTGGVIRDHASGGGVLIRDGVIDATEISDNTNGVEGGGVQARGEVTLRNVRLVGNAGSLGGGVYYLRDVALPTQALTMIGTLVRRNSAQLGGGVYAEVAKVENCQITENQASRFGAGLYITREVQITGGSITRNVAPGGPTSQTGGGLMYQPANAAAIPAVPVSATNVDFAMFGPEDNSPNDVTFQSTMGVLSYTYGPNATFECSSLGC